MKSIKVAALGALGLIFIVVTASAQNQPAAKNPPPDANLFQLVAGIWGWQDSKECEQNPHTISFSAGKTQATFRHKKPVALHDGGTAATVTYQIIYAERNMITMYLDGETRRTTDGDRVIWVLVLLDKNTYAWRRTDWEPNRKTKNILRCEPKI